MGGGRIRAGSPGQPDVSRGRAVGEEMQHTQSVTGFLGLGFWINGSPEILATTGQHRQTHKTPESGLVEKGVPKSKLLSLVLENLCPSPSNLTE